jgi:hypothetical protein
MHPLKVRLGYVRKPTGAFPRPTLSRGIYFELFPAPACLETFETAIIERYRRGVCGPGHQ